MERRKNRHQGISSKAGPASIGTPCSTRAKKQQSCGDQCHGSRSKRGERANHENLQSTGKKSRFSRGAHMEESDTCRVQLAAAAAANDPPKPNCFRQTLDPAPLEGLPRRKPLPSPSLGPLKSEISGHGSALVPDTLSLGFAEYRIFAFKMAFGFGPFFAMEKWSGKMASGSEFGVEPTLALPAPPSPDAEVSVLHQSGDISCARHHRAGLL